MCWSSTSSKSDHGTLRILFSRRISYAKKSVSENGLCIHHSCNYRSCLCFLQHLCCKWRFITPGCGNNQCPCSRKNNRRNLHVRPRYAGLVCSSGWILFCLPYPAVFYSAFCANCLQTDFCKGREPVAIAIRYTSYIRAKIQYKSSSRTGKYFHISNLFLLIFPFGKVILLIWE